MKEKVEQFHEISRKLVNSWGVIFFVSPPDFPFSDRQKIKQIAGRQRCAVIFADSPEEAIYSRDGMISCLSEFQAALKNYPGDKAGALKSIGDYLEVLNNAGFLKIEF